MLVVVATVGGKHRLQLRHVHPPPPRLQPPLQLRHKAADGSLLMTWGRGEMFVVMSLGIRGLARHGSIFLRKEF
ncbi:hypothetical protein ACU20_05990 [Actinobaculum suis]|nr:hypothetical protein ACU20_05990 [Actinobaculum suis]